MPSSSQPGGDGPSGRHGHWAHTGPTFPAKDVFAEMLEGRGDPKSIVEQKGGVQVKDSGAVEAWVDEAIAANPGPAREYAEGKDRALGFLVGQIMKASKGKANPQMVNDLIRKKLRG